MQSSGYLNNHLLQLLLMQSLCTRKCRKDIQLFNTNLFIIFIHILFFKLALSNWHRGANFASFSPTSNYQFLEKDTTHDPKNILHSENILFTRRTLSEGHFDHSENRNLFLFQTIFFHCDHKKSWLFMQHMHAWTKKLSELIK